MVLDDYLFCTFLGLLLSSVAYCMLNQRRLECQVKALSKKEFDRMDKETFKKKGDEPSYYATNGLSPVDAMKQGLLSETEYKGFLKGNVIKYIVRSDYKGYCKEDLIKAKHYIDLLLDVV